MNPACDIVGVKKSFGATHVLRDISLSLPAGKVTVLMGANGAGKSTLVKVLCGVHHADAGTVTLGGRPYRPEGPSDAIAQGVVTVHQSIADGVVADLDVASNLLLDRLADPASGLFVRRKAMRAEAARVAALMGLDLDVTAPVAGLGLADRQMIAIARAMARDPKLLILDEPTSSLSAKEAERLFALIRRLRETGVAILYISHRLSDIRAVGDRIVSMRDGQVSGVFETAPLDYEGAVTAMLGHAMTDVNLSGAARGAEVLTLDGLRLRPGAPAITMAAHAGEIVAITGLVGAGKTRTAEILFGLCKSAGGEIRLEGRPYRPEDAADAIRQGVHLCPKDRADNAVIPAFDLTGNMTLPFLKRFSRLSFLRAGHQRRRTADLIGDLGIVCRSERDDIAALSGGNQQKVIVARWLLEPCRLLVLDEPFQGVDIQARRDIGRRIRETAKGRATLVFVSELDEALEIADRILVLHDHAITGEHAGGTADTAAIIAQVSGQVSEQGAPDKQDQKEDLSA
ncbi:sugar ABC transporter ATP-binding protein [Oceaniglobus roseus]|uniref:sugar ABC transporter ATP-binding protein n=1 Tax=Oceaniglobus roseus TaxID=1737570 RepID=UPI000C7EA3B2|nr:sugar ABC transporter ATP-binding protein [Kandeliimicrobium roseum]